MQFSVISGSREHDIEVDLKDGPNNEISAGGCAEHPRKGAGAFSPEAYSGGCAASRRAKMSVSQGDKPFHSTRAAIWLSAAWIWVASSGSLGCSESVGISYRAIANVNQINNLINPDGTSGAAIPESNSLTIRVYRITEIRNKSDEDFTFDPKKTYICSGGKSAADTNHLNFSAPNGTKYSLKTQEVPAGKTESSNIRIAIMTSKQKPPENLGDDNVVWICYEGAGMLPVESNPTNLTSEDADDLP